MKTPAFLLGSTLLAASLSADALPTPEAMTKALTAARDEAAWPGLTIAEAAKNLGTPEATLRFVRDGIANASYPGSFQGAEGTLRTRTGNPLDKAFLLAELFRAQGWEAGVVSGPVPDGATRHLAKGIERPRPALEALKALASPHGRSVETRLLLPIDEERAKLDSISREVENSYALLQDALSQLDWKPKAAASAPATKATGAWVGAKAPGGEWGFYSPTFDSKKAPADFKATAPGTGAMSIAVEAVERNGKATALLSWNGSTSTVSGMDLHLGWMPKDERAKNLAELQVPMKIDVHNWQPTLQIGANQIKGQAFTLPSGGAKFAALRLTVTVDHNGRKQTMSRILHDLGPGFDTHEMIATHRLGIAAAGIPASTIETRILDELRDMSQLKAFAAGAARDTATSNTRGLSVRSAQIINTMIATANHLDPGGKNLAWQGPVILMETTKLKKRGDKVVSLNILDMLNQAYGPAANASAELKMKWGIAVCAAEAKLVKGTSVNKLMDTEGGLHQVKATGLLAGADLALGNAWVDNAAYALDADGTLRGIISERALAQAKGGHGEERAAAAGTAYAALGSAALAATGAGPLGPLVGGIAGYLNELAKAYRGAAAKLDWLARTIEAGHEVEDTSNADEQMRNLARNLLGGMAQGYATSYVTSSLGGAASGALTASGRTVTPVMDGAIDLAFGAGGAAMTLDEETIRGAFQASAPAR